MNPIQTGVAANTIKPERVAVLRGKVLDRSGQPLSGVTVTVLNHPELGQTKSRTDGLFDLAVNGGGLLTIKHARAVRRRPGLIRQRQPSAAHDRWRHRPRPA